MFTKFFPGIFDFSESDLKSMCISEHGPHGPLSPISQKLSFLFPKMIFSCPTISDHILKASSSFDVLSILSP